MPALRNHLIQLIKESGPITLARYMAEALGHPEWGYYTTRDPLGARGDFVTAPEISQMFGELIGVWLANQWQRMGQPVKISLVELGPGRGTLMEDALRSMAKVSGFVDAIDLHLVETSPVLRAAQAERLQGTWHKSIGSLPEEPTLAVANEFFDALPIHQFAKVDGQWSERMVGLDDGELILTLGGVASPDVLPDCEFLKDAPDGSIVETCPAAIDIASRLGAMIAGHGGAALIFDYGYRHPATGDSLQAVRKHEYAGILDAPGHCDLTAHVNFEALGNAFAKGGAKAHGSVAQGVFLKRLGIEIRARHLKESADEAQRRKIDNALTRLVEKDAMGELFKVLAVVEKNSPTPPGFAV